MGVSGHPWSCLKEVKPLVLFHGVRGIALEPKQGNQASSGVDLQYTEIFCIAAV